jgi:hypothetical protein
MWNNAPIVICGKHSGGLIMTAQDKEYIVKLAHDLTSAGNVMSMKELAENLRRNNILTTDKKPYKGRRGTSSMIAALNRELRRQGRNNDADMVSNAFVAENNERIEERF